MKMIKNIILGGLCVLSLSSCNDLLEIDPVNSMIPKSVEDYESLLLGGYPDQEYFMKTELMTDNVYVNAQARSEMTKDLIPWFSWASTHQLEEQEYDPYWNQLYKSIYYANTILDDLKDKIVEEESKELLETVIGEAYALRAWSYFYLANLYAEPYSQENLSKPCVPLTLTTADLQNHTSNNTRESVEVVWNQIVSDLNEASKYLAAKPHTSEFRFNNLSVEAVKARVHLFMGNWDKAIASANVALSSLKPWDMNKLQELVDAEGEYYLFTGEQGMIDTDYGKDILFSLGGGRNGAGRNIFYYQSGAQKPSMDLFNCYFEKNAEGDTIFDYRRYIFESFEDLNSSWGRQSGATVYEMYSSQGPAHCYIGLKVGEIVVTRAEAYARKNMNTEALNDIKSLLKNRIKTDHFSKFEAMLNSETDVLKRVLKERRKETAFDAGLRWFDLRRLGKPALTHIDAKGNVFELKENDLRYVLQIPILEQKASPGMELNPR